MQRWFIIMKTRHTLYCSKNSSKMSLLQVVNVWASSSTMYYHHFVIPNHPCYPHPPRLLFPLEGNIAHQPTLQRRRAPSTCPLHNFALNFIWNFSFHQLHQEPLIILLSSLLNNFLRKPLPLNNRSFLLFHRNQITHGQALLCSDSPLLDILRLKKTIKRFLIKNQ